MEILLTLAYTALFIFLIHRMDFFEAPGLSKRSFSLLFLLKVAAGLSLWAIYTFYYTDRSTADIYKYFDDSNVIFNTLKTNPLDYFKLLFGIGNDSPEFNRYYAEMHYWARKVDSSIYNDSHTIIRFNALVRLFSFGYFNVHTVVICFLSLIGLTAIYKTFVGFLSDKKRELILAVFLLPSVLFWGSGVLKEGLIFFALGLLIYYSNKLFSPKALLIVGSAMLLLAFSKFYVWLAIIPGIVYIVWVNKTSPHKLFLKFMVVIILISAIGLNVESFSSLQNPLVTLSQKQQEFNRLATGQLTDANNHPIPAANSLIEIPSLEPTLSSFIRNAPSALKNTFLRPFPWELRSPLMLLSGLETFLILLFGIVFILFMKPLKEIAWEQFIFCFSFVMIQFLIIGETTPVLGAVARYKTIALPFLMIALLLLADKQKLVKGLPFYGKIFIRKN